MIYFRRIILVQQCLQLFQQNYYSQQMSQNFLTSSLINNFRGSLSNKQYIQHNNPDEKSPQKQDVQFCLNYQQFECPKTRKRSQMTSTLNYIKPKNKQSSFPFPKMSKNRQLVDPNVPKKIYVNFDLFNPKKRNKEQLESTRLNKFEDVLFHEKEKYMERIDKHNKKKNQRCRILSNFGLNIKTIQRTVDCGRSPKKVQKIRTTLSKNSVVRRNSLNQTSIKQKQKHSMSLNKDFLDYNKNQSSLTYNSTNSQQMVLKNRIQRMINSNNMALMSYGCYINDGQIPESKYKYFVGNGNNRSVVISILKKRWWWMETSDPTAANLVWTQLRHKGTFERLQLYDSESMPLADLNKSFIFQPFYSKKPYKKIKSNTINANFRRKFQFFLPQCDRKKLLMPFQTPECVHNHYSHNFMFGNKSALFENLTTYYAYKKQDVFSIIPKTYFFDSLNSERFKQFALECGGIKNAVWIVKPGQNSNRGNGIFVAKSISEIKERISRKKSKHTYIIQRYITDLFLYQRRKFDIRTYMLALTIRGVTKYYWYNEGYIRTSSEIFDIRQLSDFFIHLTNDAVQLKSQNYGKYEAGNKISYGEFQHYLDSNYPEEKYSLKNLSLEMKQIAKIAVKATYSKIDPLPKIYSFQLFGFDFIVDDNFKPWLIQINTNPCLELNSPVLERLIPQMLENTFRLAVDPVYQPFEGSSKIKNYFLYESCLERNRFELIFDSLFDRDFEWEEYAQNEKNKVKQDSKNQYDQEGVQILINQ